MKLRSAHMLIFLVAVIVSVVTLPARAQFTNKSSVLDGSGTLSSGGTFTNISAAGQPGGISQSEQGGIVNQAGFLNTFFVHGSQDSDHDGVPDEADTDNDNDGLADTSEIGGGSFSPTTPTLVNVADSDGDGVADGSESTAGTDPTDQNAVFALTSITNAAGSRAVAWRARGNNQRTYVVRSRESLLASGGTPIFSNTVAGGTGPWFAVTNVVTDASATNTEFFAVEVTP